jgi:hypothetical protein
MRLFARGHPCGSHDPDPCPPFTPQKQHKLQREVPPLGRQDAPPSSKSSASKPQALEPQRRHKKDAKSNGDSQGAPGAGGGKRPQQEPSASGKGKEGKAPPATASNAAPSAAAPAPAPVPAPVPVEAKAPAGEASSPVEVGGKFSAATSKRKSGKKGRSSPDQKSAAAVTPPVKVSLSTPRHGLTPLIALLHSPSCSAPFLSYPSGGRGRRISGD